MTVPKDLVAMFIIPVVEYPGEGDDICAVGIWTLEQVRVPRYKTAGESRGRDSLIGQFADGWEVHDDALNVAVFLADVNNQSAGATRNVQYTFALGKVECVRHYLALRNAVRTHQSAEAPQGFAILVDVSKSFLLARPESLL